MPLNEDIEKVEALRTKLLGIMDEATVDGTIDYSLVKSIEGGREAVVSEVNNLWKEVDELQASVEQQEEQLDHRAKMADLDRWLEQPQRDKTTTGHARTGEAQKSLGELFCTNENYDIDFKRGRGAIYAEHSINDMKALFNSVTGSTGFEPRAPRTGEVVPIVHRPVQLLDILTQVGTTEPAIIYMEQTTRDSADRHGHRRGCRIQPGHAGLHRTNQAGQAAWRLHPGDPNPVGGCAGCPPADRHGPRRDAHGGCGQPVHQR